MPPPETKNGFVPYEQIKTLWNKICGEELPQVSLLTESRKRHIKARWQTSDTTKSVEWWEKFFAFITESDFLMGRSKPTNGAKKPFEATFDWVTNETNFHKIREGNYHS